MIVIIGGGVIGLSIGWQLAKSGVDVTLMEEDVCGRDASWASVGCSLLTFTATQNLRGSPKGTVSCWGLSRTATGCGRVIARSSSRSQGFNPRVLSGGITTGVARRGRGTRVAVWI